MSKRNTETCTAHSNWLLNNYTHPDYKPDFDKLKPNLTDAKQYIAQCEKNICERDYNYPRNFTCSGKAGCASLKREGCNNEIELLKKNYRDTITFRNNKEVPDRSQLQEYLYKCKDKCPCYVPYKGPTLYCDTPLIPDSSSCSDRISWMRKKYKKKVTFENYPNAPADDVLQEYLYTCEKNCPAVTNYKGPPITCDKPIPVGCGPMTDDCKNRVDWMVSNWKTKGDIYSGGKEPTRLDHQQFLYQCEKKCPCVDGYKNYNINCGSAPPPPPPPTSGCVNMNLDYKSLDNNQLTVCTANWFYWNLWIERKGENSSGKFFQHGPYDIMGWQEVGDRGVSTDQAFNLIMSCTKFNNNPSTDYYAKTPGIDSLPVVYNKVWTLGPYKRVKVAEDRKGLWGNRYLTLAYLTRKDGLRVLFVNTHGPLPDNTGGEFGLANFIDNIINEIKNASSSADIAVLVGDFNTTLDAKSNGVTIRSELNREGFVLCNSSTGTRKFNYDHIFAKSMRKDLTFEIKNEPGDNQIEIGSDHFIVKSTLVLRKN